MMRMRRRKTAATGRLARRRVARVARVARSQWTRMAAPPARYDVLYTAPYFIDRSPYFILYYWNANVP